MKNKQITPLFIAQAAMIAAIYVVLTLILGAYSYAGIQVRISEALTILPVFTPAAIPGLFIGCVISNMLSPVALSLADIVFGSLATLCAAYITWLLRRHHRLLAPLPPIVLNMIVVPLVLRFSYGESIPLYILVFTVGLGEFIACGILGMTLYAVINKYRHILFPRQDASYAVQGTHKKTD